MADIRKIFFTDGTSMGDMTHLVETDTPAPRLRELQEESSRAYLAGRCRGDIPIWADVLANEGHVFRILESVQNVTAYGTSNDLMDSHPEIREHYTIESQPGLEEAKILFEACHGGSTYVIEGKVHLEDLLDMDAVDVTAVKKDGTAMADFGETWQGMRIGPP